MLPQSTSQCRFGPQMKLFGPFDWSTASADAQQLFNAINSCVPRFVEAIDCNKIEDPEILMLIAGLYFPLNKEISDIVYIFLA